jgi:hypothetical protein
MMMITAKKGGFMSEYLRGLCDARDLFAEGTPEREILAASCKKRCESEERRDAERRAFDATPGAVFVAIVGDDWQEMEGGDGNFPKLFGEASSLEEARRMIVDEGYAVLDGDQGGPEPFGVSREGDDDPESEFYGAYYVYVKAEGKICG